MTQINAQFVIKKSSINDFSLSPKLHQLYLEDETVVIQSLLSHLDGYSANSNVIFKNACELVTSIRQHTEELSALDSFMLEYDLSSEEGVLLMCIAEALLRIPDNDTAEKLIEDKLSQADWDTHLGKSSSLFVNASTWGLMLTGRIIDMGKDSKGKPSQRLQNLVKRSGEPMIKLAMRQAMKIMGQQFVMGKKISAAIRRSVKKGMDSKLCSFDMLGEAAMTDADAERYQQSYLDAIRTLAEHQKNVSDIHQRSAISVKLSALHPRYEYSQPETLQNELYPRFKELAIAARDAGIALTMDAEEADRLVSLMMIILDLHVK